MSIGLRTKLLTIIGVGIISLGLMSAFSFMSLSSNVTEFEELLKKDVQAALTADSMTLEFKIQVQEWKNVLLRGHDQEKREKYWKKFQQQHQKVQDIGLQIIDYSTNDDVKNMTKGFLASHKALFSKYETGYQAFLNSNYDHKAGDKAVSGIDREPTKQADEIGIAALKQANEHSDAASSSASQTVSTGIISIIVTMLIIFFISQLAITRWLITPMKQAQKSLKMLSEGQLSFASPAHEGNDEIAQMLSAVDLLKNNLNQGTGAIQNSISQLSENAVQLQDIATTIQKGTEQQYIRTDQVATAITQMSAASAEVARHAQDAAGVANQVEQAAKNGVTSMRQAIATINSTSEQIANTADVVRNLEQDTKSVGTVLDVIKGIAEQTNLLALNAAIEAARAGEQGRGFAVVADEVRTLAQRTQESTAEIHTIIENVQNGAQNAVSAIESGQSRTEQSVTQVTQAGETIDDISRSVQQILGTNEQIAQAAKEQSNVADDISKNINQITSIAEDSSQHAKATLSLSDKLTQMATTLSTQIKKIKAS